MLVADLKGNGVEESCKILFVPPNWCPQSADYGTRERAFKRPLVHGVHANGQVARSERARPWPRNQRGVWRTNGQSTNIQKKTMAEFGKLLIFLGVLLIAAGIVLLLLGRTHLPIGHLPGDFLYRGKRTTVYFPLATCLILSVVLSVVLYLISRFRP